MLNKLRESLRDWLLQGVELKTPPLELEYGTNYKLSGMTLHITENLLLLGTEDGEMIQYPLPHFIDKLAAEMEEEYGEGGEDYSQMSIDYLRYLLTQREEQGDYEECARIQDVIDFKTNIEGLGGPM